MSLRFLLGPLNRKNLGFLPRDISRASCWIDWSGIFLKRAPACLKFTISPVQAVAEYPVLRVSFATGLLQCCTTCRRESVPMLALSQGVAHVNHCQAKSSHSASSSPQTERLTLECMVPSSSTLSLDETPQGLCVDFLLP